MARSESKAWRGWRTPHLYNSAALLNTTDTKVGAREDVHQEYKESNTNIVSFKELTEYPTQQISTRRGGTGEFAAGAWPVLKVGQASPPPPHSPQWPSSCGLPRWHEAGG